MFKLWKCLIVHCSGFLLVTGSSCFECADRQAGRYGRRMNYAAPDMPLGKALYIRKMPFRRLGKTATSSRSLRDESDDIL